MILNMPGLHKVLIKMLHHRCLTGCQTFLQVLNKAGILDMPDLH